ncbi:glycosyltransferase [Phytohabitans sp. ZYX-F-186]|uniref:Glycosyltransferase n=1 Tax=Phytohabitans maris TaxID=3071409 RepID=A0ABU0ZQS9_9ACTN|nr:glycosyltransferase [Phytohabitans sp. ZYX-F-186]MDQ7909389.1 glycosyltransferase [Phytohabitans sp. ZYX-F-186]
MPSIIIAAMPIHGHVTPLLAVARHLAGRGDRVRFVTGARFAAAVEATGAEHVPLPAEADFDDRQDWNATFPERAALKGTKAIAHDIEQIFVRPGRPQHDTIMAAHAAEPADAVLADPAFVGGAFLLGHPLGVRPPVVMCGICPLMISSRDTAPFGMGLTPLRGPIGRLRNAALAAVTRKVVFPPAERIAERTFRELHGRPIPFAVLDWPRHAEAIVQFTVPEFEYPRSDAPATLHFAGPVSASGSRAPLPPWWEELDGSRPVVHVTQGTIANADFGQLVEPVLQGLAGDDVLIAVATGGRPVESLPPLPANARAAEFLPYDDLLPKTGVFVTNGGYGGVQYALRYGVPIVAAGRHEDKPEVIARVEWAGVGRRLKTDTPTPAAVRGAVRAVLADRRYRDAARRVAGRMATTRGVHLLADVVDKLIAESPRALGRP